MGSPCPELESAPHVLALLLAGCTDSWAWHVVAVLGEKMKSYHGPHCQYAHVYAPGGHIWLQPRPLHTSTDVALQLFSREQVTQQILFKVSIFQYNCT